jgi:hypothetical protein
MNRIVFINVGVQGTDCKSAPAGELGHCNGLDEFAIDIGIASSQERRAFNANPPNEQYLSSSVMGYRRMNSPIPLMDFFSWQISVIREQIEIRMRTRNN